MGLELSEIEGDAILFYKFGEPPNLEEIYKQVEKMFCDFHRNIIAYDNRRFCQCKACVSAINLTLKVITHYGEFTSFNVKNFDKLIGKDVIVAHRLLKNDIEQHEYWLVTNNLLQNNEPDDLTQWMKWDSSAKQTESGEISFHYTQLGHLKDQITMDPPPQLDLSEKTKMISVSREYETDIITLFHATGDFNYRSRWQEGVKEVEEVNHFLPRVGMKCRFVLDDGQDIVYITNYSYHPERIEFSEINEKKETWSHFILEKTGDNKTKLTIDFYLKKNITTQIIFKLMWKKKTMDNFYKSLLNLEELLKEIKLPSITEDTQKTN